MTEYTREAVRALILKKDEIESEIRTIEEQLSSAGGPGVKGALVDAEGFPRSDIDVFAIRGLRNQLSRLQTDHQELMVQIEKGMAAVFSTEKPVISETTAPRRQPQVISTPNVFAIVNSVAASSPAHAAGLQQGDYVVRFGTVTRDNSRYSTFNHLVSFECLHCTDSCKHFQKSLLQMLVERLKWLL